jgi:hypothetical protein
VNPASPAKNWGITAADGVMKPAGVPKAELRMLVL